MALIGRVRKDARLFRSPYEEESPRRGRRRFYGAALPTPEQIRQDESICWQKVEAFAAGRVHEFDLKVISPVRWKGTGDKDVTLVVIRPLAYRNSAGSKLLYRDPSYLLCTDINLPIDKLLQAYLWRWEIELNFRDEKTVLGVGEAQVRNPVSCESVPALIVASYAFLLLAGCSKDVDSSCLPLPKWRDSEPPKRCTTQQFISLFRAQLWGMGMNSIKTHFVSSTSQMRTPFYSKGSLNVAARSLESAVCYAFK
jgi:hypothetical protein